MKEIIFATENKNKIKEVSDLFSNLNINVKSYKEFNIESPIENGLTFAENSEIKAKNIFEKTNIPTFAEDSGFCIDALHNFPGVFSKRFIDACGGEQNTFKIINNCIKDIKKDAFFITDICFIYKDDNNKIITKHFEGKCFGQYTYPSRGSDGFAYDFVFTPNGYDKTFAEMFEIKKQISHRRKAFDKFIDFMKSLII